MDDDELNKKMHDLDNDDLNPMAIRWGSFGRPTPTLGWFWRCQDFNKVRLGKTDEGLIGFMMNNKWGYKEYTCTPEESLIIRNMCVDIVSDNDLTKVKRQSLMNYLGTLGSFKEEDEYE